MTNAAAAPRCFALVPCAGVGLRAEAGGPKQYAMLAGQPVVAHTLAALAAVPRLAGTMVVLSPDDQVFEGLVPLPPKAPIWPVRCGGPTRAASVAAGLIALLGRGAQPDDWVLVHDAARCLLRPEWVNRLIDELYPRSLGGLLALPVADTLKQADPQHPNSVLLTVAREGKWAAQTPQMFSIGLLRRALEVAGSSVTDEASAVEKLGIKPRLVPGDYENFKITWPADFALAERLLRTR